MDLALRHAKKGLGNTGVKVPLTLLQGNELKQLDLISADRNLVYRTVQYD